MREKPVEPGMRLKESTVITVCCTGASDLYGALGLALATSGVSR